MTTRPREEIAVRGLHLFTFTHKKGLDLAPTLVPMKAGDRVKTDRRDAQRFAQSLRAGDLTAVWVPDAAREALRDLVRAREASTPTICHVSRIRLTSATPVKEMRELRYYCTHQFPSKERTHA